MVAGPDLSNHHPSQARSGDRSWIDHHQRQRQRSRSHSPPNSEHSDHLPAAKRGCERFTPALGFLLDRAPYQREVTGLDCTHACLFAGWIS
ncbi:DNA-directed RNA polymerase subunit sigma [Anopheles sinensis]|uniref:DNA-directed RNA polymerase subunit sigma n=1 Tax=Anopheles sinensis TaxID=74873 RepID=A0A084WGZ6_ANOSI|nr:DNA-directed RNA polymerase subunit sigma [Anopheles sinensis]